ncbi:uncharacterized mitochondrial protein AtMg00810-like [Vigna angularis]|uniref:uncharacterized mitochondrial protein AtMg00810-like n=1 Tax=Phaseolus angularis TaxID=3914 RepID=UPI0022B5260C|nr:uncharacterized mitochondrial protein AtMg00810-like [Vigna angularis]
MDQEIAALENSKTWALTDLPYGKQPIRYDIVLAGDNIQEIQNVKALLNAKFKIKDLGQLKYILGLEIARSQQGINLSQRKYALELLEDAGLLGCQPVSTPIQLGTKFSKTEGKPYSNVHAYRRLLDRLLYLTNTRPNLSFVVSTLSQFLSNPLEDHYAVVIRILRYIKSNPGQGLLFPSNTEHAIKAFSDSYWAACPDTRRSVIGFNVFYGASLISWKSEKQVPLFYDNQSAIQIAQNPAMHERTKHIEIDCHLIRDKVQAGVIKLLPISTSVQLADIHTKALHLAQF